MDLIAVARHLPAKHANPPDSDLDTLLDGCGPVLKGTPAPLNDLLPVTLV